VGNGEHKMTSHTDLKSLTLEGVLKKLDNLNRGDSKTLYIGVCLEKSGSRVLVDLCEDFIKRLEVEPFEVIRIEEPTKYPNGFNRKNKFIVYNIPSEKYVNIYRFGDVKNKFTEFDMERKDHPEKLSQLSKEKPIVILGGSTEEDIL